MKNTSHVEKDRLKEKSVLRALVEHEHDQIVSSGAFPELDREALNQRRKSLFRHYYMLIFAMIVVVSMSPVIGHFVMTTESPRVICLLYLAAFIEFAALLFLINRSFPRAQKECANVMREKLRRKNSVKDLIRQEKRWIDKSALTSNSEPS